ncbi:72 kDa inositol polyphosphate 5-phosphatase-like protein [Dinothrombium tinctorium]|uniref:72 kDa inositol polyphosphate 5-phosphatase-like protein n=1 Tax=Dinothrombium tinctorium TaxID=1965070 RepID=A0A3S3RZP5_9ACAR|nr:72 kDa inositol polyphosphate 5-phosphatase-like protein [Dinothrombium tinctorium]RWS12995.1 72 kDa inositol polyphosphate 5-phosphatase-like protein [Dinothrombium tinctorium]RWS13002.1 72 kDa inositol polyphosphate 5-phosphatase-like protein [Dinothrombium tinctorium]RWS16715.1 72 kDa inositol polyphosphate 5-phosphatase-like protein [Dinothrombium tinctorium]
MNKVNQLTKKEECEEDEYRALYEYIRDKLREEFCDRCLRVSIMRKIPTIEARSRSTARGYKEYLLKNENFERYFPNGTMTVFIVTWNKNSKDAPADITDLFLPQSVEYVPDLYAVGVQESANINDRQWEIEIQRTIGPSHVLLHSCSLGVLNLDIYIRRDLIWFCSMPEDDTHNTRTRCANMLKTKGAIGISFQLFGTTFLFMNSHFPAHESCLAERIEEYEKIVTSLDLPRNLLPLKARYNCEDVTGRFDCVFWFGDFNFRIEKPYMETIDLLKKENVNYLELLQYDQLDRSMKQNLVFKGFSEAAAITFPPTYKYEVNENRYDAALQRTPSYCDRVMYRMKRSGDIKCIQYKAVPQLKSSDHRPVYALFEVNLNPGRNLKSLNAGRFNREVGLEAIKRQAKLISEQNKNETIECVIN